MECDGRWKEDIPSAVQFLVRVRRRAIEDEVGRVGDDIGREVSEGRDCPGDMGDTLNGR